MVVPKYALADLTEVKTSISLRRTLQPYADLGSPASINSERRGLEERSQIED
jgi:hypothetical protein